MLDACRRAALQVPDQVAVSGVGNDGCLCDLAMPALTSVDLSPRRIGYEAAELLDRMMRGEACQPLDFSIPPRGIVARLSTDIVAVEDPVVAKAILFIRQRTCEGIDPVAVCRHACRSRSALENRFKRAVGRSVHEEIQRVRLDRVRELLAGTDLPVKQIARRAGFAYPE